MSDTLVTVEQAADELALHVKTVLRHIREGRLKAARIGKAYRIRRSDLDAFSGVARGASNASAGARATCIVDLPSLSLSEAERLTTFLHAAALTGDAQTPPLQLQTAYDPSAKALKIVAIGEPADVGKLLEMLHLAYQGRS